MSFCIKCGRELKEGEVCNCQGQVQAQNPMGSLNQPIGGTNGVGQGTSTKGNQTKLMVLIGSIAAIIGCFMPFYKVSVWGISESVSYIEGDGVIAIILAVAAIVLAVLNLQKFSLIPASIAMIVLIVDISGANDAAMGFGSLSIGAYVLLLGTILSIVGGILAFVWKIKR